MAKRKGLQGRPLAMAVSSQQGMPVPSAYHSVAKTMAPPAQADGEVQSFFCGLEGEHKSSADDYHTSVEATLNFIYTLNQNLGAQLWMV